uniref:Uncharacterized protein n=1 Tax=Arundo donax TaxID=35708 RepID=A0A0A9CQA1_ARUDO
MAAAHTLWQLWQPHDRYCQIRSSTFHLAIDIVGDIFHEIFFQRASVNVHKSFRDEAPVVDNVRLDDCMINFLGRAWVTFNANLFKLQNQVTEAGFHPSSPVT